MDAIQFYAEADLPTLREAATALLVLASFSPPPLQRQFVERAAELLQRGALHDLRGPS